MCVPLSTDTEYVVVVNDSRNRTTHLNRFFLVKGHHLWCEDKATLTTTVTVSLG